MADLTRFDFNTKRFLFSERVRRMTAAEVGSYILLLSEAWMTGKEASLPDDPEYLSRLGRVSEVSQIVLEMFPVVDTQWGRRRQNETLYDEWLEAERRSNLGRDRVSGRYNGKNEDSTIVDTTVELQKETSSEKTWFSPTQKPTQTNPNQSKSNQSKPSFSRSDVEKLSDAEIEKLNFVQGLPAKETWRKCESIWRRAKKVKLVNLGPRFSDFESWVNNYGSAHVLAAFDLWTNDLTPDFTPKFAGGMFLKNIESALEAVREVNEVVPGVETEDQLRIRMEKKLADEAIQDEIDRKRRAKDEKFELENRDQI